MMIEGARRHAVVGKLEGCYSTTLRKSGGSWFTKK